MRFGELFGMPREAAPATHRDFVAWFDGKLRSPDLHATPHALAVAPWSPSSSRCRPAPGSTSPPRTW